MDPNIQPRASAIKPMKDRSDMGPLLPFQELVSEIEVGDDVNMQSEDCKNNASEDCTLPDPCSLLHVTNRRKAPPRKKGSTAVCALSFYLYSLSFICWCTNMCLGVRRTMNGQKYKWNMRTCFRNLKLRLLFFFSTSVFRRWMWIFTYFSICLIFIFLPCRELRVRYRLIV